MQSSQEILQNKKNSIAIDKAKDIKAIAIDTEKDIEKAKAGKNLLSIEDKATMVMQTLKANPNYLRFYCKCYHQLPEGTIAFILEGARKATYPDRYFAKAAKVEMDKLGR